MPTLLLALLAKIAPGLASLLSGLFGGSDTSLAEQKGQADQKVVDQNAALDASKRMNEAAAEPAGRDVTQGSLDRGDF